jgi:hypothetical protein
MKQLEVNEIEIHVGPRGFFPFILDAAWFMVKMFVGIILFWAVAAIGICALCACFR